MKSGTLLATSAVILFGTLLSGWLYGKATGRWGPQPSMQVAAQRLNQRLPEKVGNWQLRREEQMEPEVIAMLECQAHVARTYDHVETGDTISVAVILGPPGPIAVHTPEICYSSRDYTVDGSRKRVSFKASGADHSLWDVGVKANRPELSSLRVLYGWSDGDRWEASERPRFQYAGSHHLFKIQLAGTAKPASETFAPCEDFLRAFLPQLDKQLVRAGSRGSRNR